jgi:predicted RNase H-like HicB family nuclease
MKCGRTRATGVPEAVAVALSVNVRKPGGSHVVSILPPFRNLCSFRRGSLSSPFMSAALVHSSRQCGPAMYDTEYRFTIRPLTEEEGGGYLIEFPDLPGCMSDGETIEEAIANGEDAKRYWIAARKEARRPIGPPSVEPAEGYSGKW